MRDVIVIGAGAGGPVVAKELAARGLDVLLLEAGPRHLRPRESWSHLESDMNNPVTGMHRIGPGDRSRGPYLREMPDNQFILQVQGVGGTTVHYFGNAPRAYPGAFQDYRGRDRDNYDREFPIPLNYCDFIPYFEWVEETLPIRAAPMGRKEVVFLRGAERMGLPVQRTKDRTRASHGPQPNAILQPKGNAGRTSDPRRLKYPDAEGCTFCGHCIEGCMNPIEAPRNQFAKRSTDNSYVPMALTADMWKKGGRAATLITDAFATRIHYETVGSEAVARAVTWRDSKTGDSHTEEAKVVVMSGGCIENPRLWFNSELPNPNDWVGRGATDHQLDMITGEFPFYTGSSKGPGSNSRADFPGYGGLENFAVPPALESLALTFSDAGMHGLYDNGLGRSPAGADTYGRLVGNDLRRLLENGIDQVMSCLVVVDDYVEAKNRVTLSQQLPPDEHGPVPKYEMFSRDRHPRTKRNRDYLARKAVKLMRKAGATRVHHTGYPPLHIQSTMRIGGDPRTSVCDPTGEARFAKRIYVADCSAMPNALGGPNPTMTTQALATWSAENIFVKYFGGDPWVKREYPVVSTDPKVTRGVVKRRL